MDSSNTRSPEFKDSTESDFQFIDTVSRCLTKKHEDCLGAYVNRILGLKLVCTCKCHSIGRTNKEGEVDTGAQAVGTSKESLMA